MSSCENVQELISRMLDEELTPKEAALVEQHRRECPDCAALYAAFRTLSSTLSENLAEPPEALRENVMAELRRNEIRVRNRRAWRGVLTAAACLLIFIGITQFINPRLDRKSVLTEKTPQSVVTGDFGAMTAASGAMVSAPSAEEEFAAPNSAPMERSASFEADYEAVGEEFRQEDTALKTISLNSKINMKDLMDFLHGEASDLAKDALSPAFSYKLQLSDGYLELYLLDGCLYYRDSVSQQIMRCTCDESALFAFLTRETKP